jgi:hypothetical protein
MGAASEEMEGDSSEKSVHIYQNRASHPRTGFIFMVNVMRTSNTVGTS